MTEMTELVNVSGLSDIVASAQWLLILIAIMIIGGVILARRREWGPFKNWPIVAIVFKGNPPNCPWYTTKARVGFDPKGSPYAELKNPSGAIVALPNYRELVNSNTMCFYAFNREEIHPMLVKVDAEESKYVRLTPVLDDRVKVAYKQNTMMTVDRTENMDKLTKLLPFLSIGAGIIAILFTGWWISNMATGAAGAAAAAAQSAAKAIESAAGVIGQMPP